MSPSTLTVALLVSLWTVPAQTPLSPRISSPKVDPEEYKACGVNTLYAACLIMGKEVTFEQVRDLLRPQKDGSNSLAELAAAAEKLGLFPIAAKLDVQEGALAVVPAPAIMHLRKLEGEPEGNHFGVYLGRDEDGSVGVLDPPDVPSEIDRSRFLKLWTGNVLILCKTQADADAVGEEVMGRWHKPWYEPLFWTVPALVVLLLWILRRGKDYAQATMEEMP